MILVDILERHSSDDIFTLLRQLAKELEIQVDPFIADPTLAAVLIPIVKHDVPTVVLTERTSHLNQHAGQISFPGGRMEPDDIDLQSCVLRETHEEIGVSLEKIAMVNDLGLWPSYSGYVVKPFIGIITPPVKFTPCSHEVAEIFEVPLTFILDKQNYQRIEKSTPIPHHYYQMDYQGKIIWGLTASILMLLAALVQHHQSK